jgi:adenine/guanine phosphoribosyltransferase-like PRPP-binding protein
MPSWPSSTSAGPANESQVMNIIGDVEGKTCVIVDDLVDTAGTLCKAAAALKEHGAERVVAYITHPVLSGKAIDNISDRPGRAGGDRHHTRCGARPGLRRFAS